MWQKTKKTIGIIGSGEEAAHKMVNDMPQDIIDGKEVFTDDPVPFKKKKWFDFSSPSFYKEGLGEILLICFR